jgi:hypothetical protein
MDTTLKTISRYVLLSLLASPCWAQTITLVQHAFGNSGATSATSQTAVFASNPAQNNLLVAGGGNKSGGTISSCSDTLANTWTVVQTVANGTNSNSGICWARQTHMAGADTVTMNDSTAGIQFFVGIAEYSVTTSWPTTPTDVGSTGTGTATAVTTGNFTTTGTDVIFAIQKDPETQTITAGSGYTLLDTAPAAAKAGDENKLNAAAGTYAGTFTNGAVSAGWSVSAEAFKPAAPAPTGCTNFIALMGAGCK